MLPNLEDDEDEDDDGNDNNNDDETYMFYEYGNLKVITIDNVLMMTMFSTKQ